MLQQTDFRLDAHTHTIASGHAYGTIREMAAAASERGLDLLGVTEHGPGIPGTCDPIYFCNLSAVPRRLYGVEVLHGCEANVLDDGTLSLSARHLKYLDYAIAGIHLFCYHDAGPEKNTDNVISCMKVGKVRFISHPDSDRMPVQYDRLVQAAKDAQAYDFIMSFPDGFDTRLDQGGVNVSGGQKQRLCIARAMVRKPAVLILDDSTSAVDSATEGKIRESFRENLKGTTVIIIAQRISSVQYADKIVVLDEGTVTDVGTHDELMESSKIYREIYDSQQEGGDGNG